MPKQQSHNSNISRIEKDLEYRLNHSDGLWFELTEKYDRIE